MDTLRIKQFKKSPLQENVVFAHAKSYGSWQMCKENFVVSFITMLQYVMFIIKYLTINVFFFFFFFGCLFCLSQ